MKVREKKGLSLLEVLLALLLSGVILVAFLNFFSSTQSRFDLSYKELEKQDLSLSSLKKMHTFFKTASQNLEKGQENWLDEQSSETQIKVIYRSNRKCLGRFAPSGGAVSRLITNKNDSGVICNAGIGKGAETLLIPHHRIESVVYFVYQGASLVKIAKGVFGEGDIKNTQGFYFQYSNQESGEDSGKKTSFFIAKTLLPQVKQ